MVGLISGNLAKCWRTWSRYERGSFNLLMRVAMPGKRASAFLVGVLEWIRGRRTTQGGPLELLALEQALRILDGESARASDGVGSHGPLLVYLQEADVVAGDGLDEVLGGRDLAKSHLEMVGI